MRVTIVFLVLLSVVAVDRLEASPGGGTVPPDADLLEPLSLRATRISLGEGQSQDLTLRFVRR